MISQRPISSEPLSNIWRNPTPIFKFAFNECRVVTVAKESREVDVPFESRSITIGFESRIVTVEFEDRTVKVTC